MAYDLTLVPDEGADTLRVQIERGHIGATTVELATHEDGALRVVRTLTWDQIDDSTTTNAAQFDIPIAELLGP